MGVRANAFARVNSGAQKAAFKAQRMHFTCQLVHLGDMRPYIRTATVTLKMP